MRDILIQTDTETSNTTEKSKTRALAVSKPYLTVFLLVMILLSVWAELCPT